MNDDEYINSITLEYLLNPTLYTKISEQKNNSDHLIFKDIKFYKKRICQITKDMCKGEYINDNLKILFLNYASTIIYYLKQTDAKDIYQQDYSDLTEKLSSNLFVDTDISTVDFSSADNLLINIPNPVNNLDNFVKKLNVNLEQQILPKKRVANLKDPVLKKKGVKKKISS